MIDNEYEITDEGKLAKLVAQVLVGHFAMVERIISGLPAPTLIPHKTQIAMAKKYLDAKTQDAIIKRDGWVFQIISHLALLSQNKAKKIFSQQPQDAPGQHGIDGLAIILNKKNKITSIIICEDKCTSKGQRALIERIWKEFTDFEKGVNNSKLVARISVLLNANDSPKILAANHNNICNNDLRQYRVGINRNIQHSSKPSRTKLFKGYDGCIKGTNPHRRFASTMESTDIRKWMEAFCKKVAKTL